MNRKFIPVEEACREWEKDPEFRAAYDALEEEFARAAALIKASGKPITKQKRATKATETAKPASGPVTIRRN